MFRGWIWMGTVVAALVIPGCSSPAATPSTTQASGSSGKSTTESPAPESDSSSPGDEAVAPLDGDACVEITGASLDLSAAMNKTDARTAADTLEKYAPVESAKKAIEHFADTGGAQIDDADYSKYNDDLDNWVHQVCPPA